MNKSIKLAIAACGLVGSMSFNPSVEIEYLEDDSLFATTTAQLANGWEWGFSTVQAQQVEVICCGWLTPGWDDHFGGFGGGGGSGGGGDDNSGNDDPEDSEGDADNYRIEACLADVKRDLNRCNAIAGSTGLATGALCPGFTHPLFIGACFAAAGIGTIIGQYECADMAIGAEFLCKTG